MVRFHAVMQPLDEANTRSALRAKLFLQPDHRRGVRRRTVMFVHAVILQPVLSSMEETSGVQKGRSTMDTKCPIWNRSRIYSMDQFKYRISVALI
ncbi:hypothetical protein VQ056_14375 [Paenibacillus sp. JTLBN-2024]